MNESQGEVMPACEKWDILSSEASAASISDNSSSWSQLDQRSVGSNSCRDVFHGVCVCTLLHMNKNIHSVFVLCTVPCSEAHDHFYWQNMFILFIHCFHQYLLIFWLNNPEWLRCLLNSGNDLLFITNDVTHIKPNTQKLSGPLMWLNGNDDKLCKKWVLLTDRLSDSLWLKLSL